MIFASAAEPGFIAVNGIWFSGSSGVAFCSWKSSCIVLMCSNPGEIFLRPEPLADAR